MTNHFRLGDAWPAGAGLADIAAPTLVLHGTADPMFPLAHGQAAVQHAVDRGDTDAGGVC